MFKISEIIEEDIAILQLSGVMLDAEVMQLNERIRKLSAGHITNIILDIGEVKTMNSCFGLGILVANWGCLNRSGGKLVLAAPGKKVLQLLRITRLDQLLEIYPNAELAKAAFHPAALPI
jgi:anti-anti-sigma factor